MRLPFELDRNSVESLTSQLARGVSQGVSTGFWKPGDILPSLDDFAAATGVSQIVVRHAMRRLAAEGVVNPRPGIGTVVLDPSSRIWRGHVAIVDFETRSNFLVSRVSGILRANLIRANYLPSVVSVAAEEYDTAPLAAMLRQPVSLAVVMGTGMGHFSPSLKLIAAAGVSAIGFCPDAVPNSPKMDCLIRFSRAEAWEAFAARCEAAGVRRMAQVWLREHEAYALPDSFRQRGIQSEMWDIVPDTVSDPIENVQTATTAFFEERLSRSSPDLPDVIYFSDDYAATAAIVSLLRHGVRIPGDVGVVSHVNGGSAPPFPGALTSIEIDPLLAAGMLTDAVLSFLIDRRPPQSVTIPAVFRDGASL